MTQINVEIAPQHDLVFMTTAEDRGRKCFAHAEQCKAWAELTTHPQAKEEFIHLADEWTTLAGEIADIERMKIFVRKAGDALRSV